MGNVIEQGAITIGDEHEAWNMPISSSQDVAQPPILRWHYARIRAKHKELSAQT